MVYNRLLGVLRKCYLFLLFHSQALWQPSKTRDLSTAGTTASTVIFRKNHIFVANVRDSTAIMGVINPQFGKPGQPQVVAQLLTKDHTPDDPSEQEHIRSLGKKSIKGHHDDLMMSHNVMCTCDTTCN